MKKVIEIKNLYKKFGDVEAVCGLSFSVNEGELFAFLGVNGAGKSTTISIICGELSMDSGMVIVNGHDAKKEIENIKRDLGVVFQSSVLDKNLSVKDNLMSRAGLYGIFGNAFKRKLDELSDMLDFKDIINRRVGKLSGGQRRRIDIARALIHNPKILILDEPTTGLDPQTRKITWNAISKLRKEGMTVLLTTHYMEEASDADYVIIIDSGKKVAEGTPYDLKNKYTGDFITLYGTPESLVSSLNIDYEKFGDSIRIEVPSTQKATELILKYPDLFVDYEIVKGKMDDVFLSATGKNLFGGSKND